MQIQGLLCKTAKSKSFCKAGTFSWRLSLFLFLCSCLLFRSCFPFLCNYLLFRSRFLSFFCCHNMFQIFSKVYFGWSDFLFTPSQYYYYIFSLYRHIVNLFCNFFPQRNKKLYNRLHFLLKINRKFFFYNFFYLFYQARYIFCCSSSLIYNIVWVFC